MHKYIQIWTLYLYEKYYKIQDQIVCIATNDRVVNKY